MKTGSNFPRQFKTPASHSDWGGINYEMEIGKIIKYEGQAGVIIGDPLPNGKIPCWVGNETKRQEIKVEPFTLTIVEPIDLTPDENEAVLPLMQSLVLRVLDDKKPF